MGTAPPNQTSLQMLQVRAELVGGGTLETSGHSGLGCAPVFSVCPPGAGGGRPGAHGPRYTCRVPQPKRRRFSLLMSEARPHGQGGPPRTRLRFPREPTPAPSSRSSHRLRHLPALQLRAPPAAPRLQAAPPTAVHCGPEQGGLPSAWCPAFQYGSCHVVTAFTPRFSPWWNEVDLGHFQGPNPALSRGLRWFPEGAWVLATGTDCAPNAPPPRDATPFAAPPTHTAPPPAPPALAGLPPRSVLAPPSPQPLDSVLLRGGVSLFKSIFINL